LESAASMVLLPKITEDVYLSRNFCQISMLLEMLGTSTVRADCAANVL
jgi:hypothetical protein